MNKFYKAYDSYFLISQLINFFFTRSIYGNMNKVMKFLRYSFFYTLLHLSLTGSSFMQIGDNVTIKLDSNFTYRYTDNILRDDDAQKISDSVSTFTPGLELLLGQTDAGIDIGVSLAYAFNRYYKSDALDTRLLKFSMDGALVNDTNFNTNFIFSMSDDQVATPTVSSENQIVATLIELSNKDFSFESEYTFSPKLSLAFGIESSKLRFEPPHAIYFASKDSMSIPLKLIYEYSKKFDIVYGLEFLTRDIGPRTAFLGLNNLAYENASGYSSNAYFYNIGFRGDILPKLSGGFTIGYRTIEFNTQNLTDRDAIGLESNLVWRVTPKVNSNIFIIKTFDASGDGNTYDGLSLNTSTSFAFTPQYYAGLNLGFSKKDYRSRTDKLFSSALTLSYVPSQNYSVTAGLYNTDSSSNGNFTREFNANDFRISVDLKY